MEFSSALSPRQMLRVHGSPPEDRQHFGHDDHLSMPDDGSHASTISPECSPKRPLFPQRRSSLSSPQTVLLSQNKASGRSCSTNTVVVRMLSESKPEPETSNNKTPIRVPNGRESLLVGKENSVVGPRVSFNHAHTSLGFEVFPAQKALQWNSMAEFGASRCPSRPPARHTLGRLEGKKLANICNQWESAHTRNVANWCVAAKGTSPREQHCPQNHSSRAEEEFAIRESYDESEDDCVRREPDSPTEEYIARRYPDSEPEDSPRMWLGRNITSGRYFGFDMTESVVSVLTDYNMTVELTTEAKLTTKASMEILYHAHLIVMLPEKVTLAREVTLQLIVSNGIQTDRVCHLDVGQCSLSFAEDGSLPPHHKKQGSNIDVTRSIEDVHKPLDVYMVVTYPLQDDSVVVAIPTFSPQSGGKVIIERVWIAEPSLPLVMKPLTSSANSWRQTRSHSRTLRFERSASQQRQCAWAKDHVCIAFAELTAVRFHDLAGSLASDTNNVWNLDMRIEKVFGVNPRLGKDLQCHMSFDVGVGESDRLITLDSNGWIPKLCLIDGRLGLPGQWREDEHGYFTLLKQADMVIGQVLKLQTWWHEFSSPYLPELVSHKVLEGKLLCALNAIILSTPETPDRSIIIPTGQSAALPTLSPGYKLLICTGKDGLPQHVPPVNNNAPPPGIAPSGYTRLSQDDLWDDIELDDVSKSYDGTLERPSDSSYEEIADAAGDPPNDRNFWCSVWASYKRLFKSFWNCAWLTLLLLTLLPDSRVCISTRDAQGQLRLGCWPPLLETSLAHLYQHRSANKDPDAGKRSRVDWVEEPKSEEWYKTSEVTERGLRDLVGPRSLAKREGGIFEVIRPTEAVVGGGKRGDETPENSIDYVNRKFFGWKGPWRVEEKVKREEKEVEKEEQPEEL